MTLAGGEPSTSVWRKLSVAFEAACEMFSLQEFEGSAGGQMPKLRLLVLVQFVVFSVCQIGCSGGAPAVQQVPPPPPPPPAAAALGGSNYGWYNLTSSCDREPYGVVYNYNTAATTIVSQLQQMYNNGQRRLRIPIYHARGINSGTIMDSTGGNLAPQFVANLANLLAAV